MATPPITPNVFAQMMRDWIGQYAYPPEIHFARHNVPPPSVEYFGPDDELQVSVFTSATTTGLQLALRFLDSTGAMKYEVETLDGATLNTITTKIFPIPEGYLLGAAVTNLGGGLADGVCWVSMGLQQSLSPNRPLNTVLAQGFVTNLYGVEWPAPPVRVGAGSGGTLIPTAQTVANPAAGADWIFTVPAGKQFYLKSVFHTLVTSATVATRTSQIIVDDGSHTMYKSEVTATQAASLTVNYTGGSGLLDSQATPQQAHVSLPTDMPLLPTWRVRSITNNIQAADQYSNIAMCLLQFS